MEGSGGWVATSIIAVFGRPRRRRASSQALPLITGFVRELTEHATQRAFVYRHTWRVGDLVMWDNRATMHRGRPYEDTKHPRDLRRTTLTCGAPVMGFAQSQAAPEISAH
jgi:hypothetical protein